jgi:hypothetical protein
MASKSAFSRLALVLAATLISGCAQKPLCPELGSCGGDIPFGAWALAPGYPSCMEDLYLPPTDTRLVTPNVPEIRTSPPEPAVFDWCDLLVASGGPEVQAFPPRFFYESGQIGTSNLRINNDADSKEHPGLYSFSVSLTRTGTFYLEFPPICVRGFGAMDKPFDPANPETTGDVCHQLQAPIAASGLGEGSYRNTVCVANPNDPPNNPGCTCRFDVTETGGPSGFVKRLGASTLEFTLQTTFPNKVTYCNHGESLDLTAADGDYLFAVKGLRTFKMKRVADMGPPPTP